MKNIYITDLNVDKSKINPYISQTLLDKIEESLKNNKKSMIYINKRGEFTSLICRDCSYIYKCDNCDVSLTLHKKPEKLICHHCMAQYNVELSCKKCWGNNLEKVWVWSEQIEDILSIAFPQASIFRIDTDEVKNVSEKKLALEKLDTSQIIIGTKMITTGFDFDNIWVIWVILVEQELQIPRYDTGQTVYCNIKQLIWRWWRSGTTTDIVLQSYVPNNEFIKDLVDLNYKDYFIKTLNERKLFHYPPFCELVSIVYKSSDKNKALEYTTSLYEKLLNSVGNEYLHSKFNKQIFDWEIFFTKIPYKRNNQFHYKILIKWDNVRGLLDTIKSEILSNKDLSVIF